MKRPSRSYFRVFRFRICLMAASGMSTLSFLMIISCAPKPKLPLEKRTPQNVLSCARQNLVEFTSLAGLLDLKLKGKEAKYSGTVEIYYQAPDTFAFYPRSFFGMDIFEAQGRDDSLTIYFPGDNQYFTGEYSDLENTRLWSWQIPFRLISDLILGKGGLSDTSLTYFSPVGERYGYKSEDDSWIKEYYIDASKCRLIKSRLTRKKDGVYFLIDFKTYKRYDGEENPAYMKIISSAGDVASIKFRDMKYDINIPERKLHLKIPPDCQRVGLKRNE